MRTLVGCAWRRALLTASCAMRSSSCWRSGARPSPVIAPSKLHIARPSTVDALGELAQRELEAHAAGLIGTQRHRPSGARRRGPRLARSWMRVRMAGSGELRAQSLHGFFGGAELHEDAGEALREAVVDFLADAIAFGEHGGVLRRHAEFLEADAQA